jgi:hypothetical protein
VAGGNRKIADDAFALALAAGSTIEAAARHAKISERTAYRRLKDPVFVKRVEHIRADLIQRTVARLAALGTIAADALGKLIQSKDERVRLGAARATLDYLYRGAEIFELERRLRELEELVKPEGAEKQESWR